jgi:hypothetical protein
MGFNFWSKRSANIFSEFATKNLASSAKIFLNALTTGIIQLTPFGAILIEGGKVMMDTLLSKSSQIEKKIDRLIREPLLSGINFLHQGILFPVHDENTEQARDNLLHEAHVSLTKALMLFVDSYEDVLFIRSLDLIAVCAHSMYCLNTESQLTRSALDIQDEKSKLETLEELKTKQVKFSEAYERFLAKDSYRDKPFGYGEQKLYGRIVKNYAIKIEKQAKESREKLDILINMHDLAKKLCELNMMKI